LFVAECRSTHVYAFGTPDRIAVLNPTIRIAASQTKPSSLVACLGEPCQVGGVNELKIWCQRFNLGFPGNSGVVYGSHFVVHGNVLKELFGVRCSATLAAANWHKGGFAMNSAA